MQSFLSRWMPVDASAHGAEIDSLIALVHWLMLVLFVGWSIYFVYVLWRFRASKNPQASYEGARTHFSSYVEGGVVVAEAVLLAAFAIPAWASWVTMPPESDDPVEIRVVAQQFAWNVHYPGPDGMFGRTDPSLVNEAANPLGLDRSDPLAKDDVFSLNQLHLPVDRQVVIYLTSKDVIHGFYLPQLRVKQDAIPGIMIPVHFRAVATTPEESQFPGCAATGTCWEIACVQLCGLTHFRMRGYTTVHDQAGYDAWLAERVANLPSMRQAQPAPETPAEDVEPSEGEATEAAQRS